MDKPQELNKKQKGGRKTVYNFNKKKSLILWYLKPISKYIVYYLHFSDLKWLYK